MATTEAKTGFRLPWSADRYQADRRCTCSRRRRGGDPEPPRRPDSPPPDEETESPAMIDAAPAATTPRPPSTRWLDGRSHPHDRTRRRSPAAATAARKPNKFMADLTKAMQTAAESARTDSIERLSVDAKTHIEAIHADSANEADRPAQPGRRRRRRRSATGRRPRSPGSAKRPTSASAAARPSSSGEVEEHAAAIERASSASRRRVAAFEAEMADFFERLLAEDDPTRFAAMAESLPEPPSFDDDAPAASLGSPQAVAVAEAGRRGAPRGGRRDRGRRRARARRARPGRGAHAETRSPRAETPVAEEPAGRPTSRVWPSRPPRPTATTCSASAPMPAGSADDPRMARARPDPGLRRRRGRGRLVRAPTHAAPTTRSRDRRRRPRRPPGRSRAGRRRRAAECRPRRVATRVIVVGLVSVASIAGFKRHLSRVAGVQSRRRVVRPRGRVRLPRSRTTRSVSLRDVVAGPAGLRRPRDRRVRRGPVRSPPRILRPEH